VRFSEHEDGTCGGGLRRTSGALERSIDINTCLSKARQRPAEPIPVLSRESRPRVYQPWKLSTFITNMALIMLACVPLQPVTAAKVSWENCLPDSYLYNEPTLLQWQPHEVDAWFDTENPKHTLRVTMWGNVTGSLYNVTLPPPNSSAWTDPTKLDGKILREPEPDSSKPRLTTLYSKVDFLSYEPWSVNTDFCNTSLQNSECRLAPVFKNISVMYVPVLFNWEMRRKLIMWA